MPSSGDGGAAMRRADAARCKMKVWFVLRHRSDASPIGFIDSEPLEGVTPKPPYSCGPGFSSSRVCFNPFSM